MRYGIFISATAFLFSGFHASGQARDGYLFRHITQTDGLINNSVFAITQDERGFIWIGTQNGLQRYDGKRFFNYQDELNPENKSSMAISSIEIIKRNQLLVSPLKKLDLFSNNVSNYSKKDMLNDIKDSNDIYHDGLENTWIVASRYAYFCVKDSVSATCSMAKDKLNHQTWVTSPTGLILLDGNGKKIYSSTYNPMHDPLLDQSIKLSGKELMIDSHHDLWILNWTEKFYRYNLATGKLTTYSLPSIKLKNHLRNTDFPLAVNNIFEDNHHQIWLGTANAGLMQYDREKDAFNCIISQQDNSRGIQYNYEVFCVFQDKDENIWLGTDRGINIFNPYHQYFKIIRNDEYEERALPKREINGIIQTRQGDIWVATWGGGIVVYSSQWVFKKRISFSGSFESNLIWSLQENDDGKIWIGCQHGYIHTYDPVNGTVSTTQPDEFQKSTVRCMKKDKDGNILFGLHNGRIATWNKKSNKFYGYDIGAVPSGFGFSPVHNIFIDRRGICWVGTEMGLKVFDIEKKIFTAVYYPGKSKANSCEGIEETNDSTLLVGIVNGGLSSFNKTTKTFSFPDVADKLSSSTVHAIQKDAVGNVWFTTDYNLYKLNPGLKNFISYNTEPGVINSCFQSTGFYPLKGGRWLSATFTEIICFYPDTLNRKNNVPLPVEITGLKLFDKPVFVDSILFKGNPLLLTHKQNFITIEFAVLSFSNIRQIKYYYRLSGIDPTWVNGDVLGTASYTNLAPGNYTFYVKADDEGKQGEVTAFRFMIAPAFWQTWLFRAGVILLGAYIIYWLVRKRIKTIRRQAALKQQVAETEMMALRAQMNPHFIFNCINSIDAMIQSNDKYQATLYLNKFARLIRNILDSSKQNTVTLAKDLQTLRLYLDLEQFRNDNRFACEIQADPALLQDDYRVPPLIIQPYVENAILHGLRYRSDSQGKLSITVNRQDGHIVYIIEDNGVGRHSANQTQQKEKQSYGIEMSSDRVRLFNQESKASVEITDLQNNGLPAGTKVKVSLKIL